LLLKLGCIEIKYPDFEDAIASNKAIMIQFGGTHAVLNIGNLKYCIESAKDIPESSSDAISAKAAHLIYCLVGNHPFLDGNKRTAFNVAHVFVKLNGFELEAITPEEAVSVLAKVAEGEVNESQLIVWVKKYLRKID
jgi:death-on-curing protein